jgi:hypothetical protein
MTGSGRSGTWEFQQNRQLILAASDVCGLCGHHGARTVDHIIPKPQWPRLADGRTLAPGFDGLRNLQPAHGSMGSDRTRKVQHNWCFACDPVNGRLCNQSKGGGQARVRTSRNWYTPG